MKIILTWLLFFCVIGVNALANILPINGYNTGQIASFYPNSFVPAGFTFSIWGVIYAMLLNYCIANTYYTIRAYQFPAAAKLTTIINPFFWLSCILNVSWILAWHYLWVTLSVFIMLLFLGVLIRLFLVSYSLSKDVNKLQQFLLIAPFTIYLGWISVATIANITALLVKYQWNGFGLPPVYWTILMILIAIGLGIYILNTFKIVGYTIVIIWALIGIRAAQFTVSETIFQLANVGVGILLAAISLFYLDRFRKNKIV